MTPEEKVRFADRVLAARYGEPKRSGLRDPLWALIKTILSQNTSDMNRDRAYARLRERFPTPQTLHQASLEEIAEAIRSGGLARQKAERIKGLLDYLQQRYGSYDLSWICRRPPQEVEAEFRKLKGIGPKTIKVVLLFVCGHPVFPADTHITRISKRLGLVPPRASSEKVHEILEGLVPPERYYPFHLNLIRFGREICRARSPLCPQCPLASICEAVRQFYPQKGL